MYVHTDTHVQRKAATLIVRDFRQGKVEGHKTVTQNTGTQKLRIQLTVGKAADRRTSSDKKRTTTDWQTD